jgi:hypothetical protein
MNTHIKYLLTCITQTFILYISLIIFKINKPDFKDDHINSLLLTNFIATYSGLYILDYYSSFN